MQSMTIQELSKHVNEKIALRPPVEAKINEYAERMEVGAKFPPIVIGQWPLSEKYGQSGIVDGLNRLAAAAKAKLKEFPIETKQFASLSEMLTYMYTANMAHGIPVSEGQRNTRIKLLRSVDPNMTLEKIASVFMIGKSTVDRIIKGETTSEKPGVRTGTSRSKSHKNLSVIKPKAFFTMLEKIVYTMERVRAAAEIIAYAMPEQEKDGKTFSVPDKEKLHTINQVQKFLTGMVKEMS